MSADHPGGIDRLLWDEYPHVKRCVKSVLENNVIRRELAYAAALQRALDLYASERAHRAAGGDGLALSLDALGAVEPYPCAVSATLFSANYDIQSLLVSQDPLVKHAEEFLRRTIEAMAHADRFNCRFDAVVAAYLDFAARHRDRVVAAQSPSAFPSLPVPPVTPATAAPVVDLRSPLSSGTRLPLGLQPYVARLAGVRVAFPTAAAWAAFVANKTLWQRLVGAPTLAAATLEHPEGVAAPPAAVPRKRVPAGRVPGGGDDRWPRRDASTDDSGGGGGGWSVVGGGGSRWPPPLASPPSSSPPPPPPPPPQPRAVFLLAPDVDDWERVHGSSMGVRGAW